MPAGRGAKLRLGEGRREARLGRPLRSRCRRATAADALAIRQRLGRNPPDRAARANASQAPAERVCRYRAPCAELAFNHQGTTVPALLPTGKAERRAEHGIPATRRKRSASFFGRADQIPPADLPRLDLPPALSRELSLAVRNLQFPVRGPCAVATFFCRDSRILNLRRRNSPGRSIRAWRHSPRVNKFLCAPFRQSPQADGFKGVDFWPRSRGLCSRIWKPVDRDALRAFSGGTRVFVYRW
jgi:hypothetical protein